MGVEVTFRCGGCEASAGPIPVKAEHVPIFGGGSGWCARVEPKVADSAPEGWIAFDPYTLCTYCPKCWAEITAPDEPAPTDREPGEGR